jgi:serine/threonine protein kinase
MNLGQVIGDRYRLEELLGKQAGRRTFLARDLQSDRLVVVKILIFSPDFEWTDLKLFEREAETLKHLDCRSIPEYLDYFEVETETYKGFALVQSYIEAKSLKQQVEEGRKFTEPDLQEIARSLLGILSYLHGLNPPIVHRDLKPSNILVKDRTGHSIGNVYLVDFGSVQNIAHREQATLTIVGTYGYMPPEQFGGRTVPASDLYSLGATLIYLATGVQPADLPQKDGKIQFENLVGLSPAFTRWIGKAIDPSLDKRFSSAKEAMITLNTLHEIEISAKIAKPAGSRAILKKTDEKFQIHLPPEGFSAKLIMLVPFAIAWNSFLVVWTGGAAMISFGINLFFMLFSIPFWVVGLGMISGILYCLAGSATLIIDAKEISLQHKIFGINLPTRAKMAREAIDRIQRSEGYSRRDSDGDPVHVPPALVIWAGTKEFKLSSQLKEYLTRPELDWLASELSEWLGIEVSSK